MYNSVWYHILYFFLKKKYDDICTIIVLHIIYIHIYIYTCIHTYVHEYAYVYVYVHVYVYVYIHVYVRVYGRLCICICVGVYMKLIYVYILQPYLVSPRIAGYSRVILSIQSQLKSWCAMQWITPNHVLGVFKSIVMLWLVDLSSLYWFLAHA